MKRKFVKITCKSCHGGYRAIVMVKNGKIIHIKGDSESLTEGTMRAKGLASIQEAYNPN